MAHYLPDLYALNTLLFLSVQVLIVRAGVRHYSAYSASQLMTWGNLAFLGAYGLWETPLSAFTPEAVLYYMGSGVFGYTLSRTTLCIGYERIGAARTTALHGATPLLSALLAVALLGEKAGFWVFLGTAGIMAGVWLIAEERGGGEWRRRDVIFPLLAAVGTSFSMICRKMGLTLVDAPAMGMAVSCLTASLLLPLAWRFTPGMEGARCTRRGGAILILAAFLNSIGQFTLMRSLLTAGVAYTVPLYSASPLVVLLLAALFMRQSERLTLRLAWAVLLTGGGAALIASARHGLLG
ncbi:MAG: EamA family transporter [Nitrospinota bacterium]|mgnify:FL=1